MAHNDYNLLEIIFQNDNSITGIIDDLNLLILC